MNYIDELKDVASPPKEHCAGIIAAASSVAAHQGAYSANPVASENPILQVSQANVQTPYGPYFWSVSPANPLLIANGGRRA